jgi:hypothetical protein
MPREMEISGKIDPIRLTDTGGRAFFGVQRAVLCVARSAASICFNQRSKTNVPNGTTEAIAALSQKSRDHHGRRIVTSATERKNKMKSAPCTEPTMRTAIGMPAKYLSGIAIPSSTRYEMPSSTPMKQSRRIGVFSIVNQSSVKPHPVNESDYLSSDPVGSKAFDDGKRFTASRNQSAVSDAEFFSRDRYSPMLAILIGDFLRENRVSRFCSCENMLTSSSHVRGNGFFLM